MTAQALHLFMTAQALHLFMTAQALHLLRHLFMTAQALHLFMTAHALHLFMTALIKALIHGGVQRCDGGCSDGCILRSMQEECAILYPALGVYRRSIPPGLVSSRWASRGVLGCCPTERQGPDVGARVSESSGMRGRIGFCLDALLPGTRPSGGKRLRS